MAATTTPFPTATSAPTTTPVVPSLPKTGAGDTVLPGALILFGAGFAALIAGLALLRRRATLR